jgi:hypothetical protein
MGLAGRCESLDPAKGAGKDRLEGGALDSRHQQAPPGDHAQQAYEGVLHRGQVRIDVRVIELQVADDRDVRQVVHELGPLVEEGAVVLVAFHHEVRPPPSPVAPSEVVGDPPDQERGIEAGTFEDEGEEARGRGLAVRARHHQGGSTADELLPQEGGLADHPLLAIEHLLHLGVPAGERVADHHEVGLGGHIIRRIGGPDGEAQALELA